MSITAPGAGPAYRADIVAKIKRRIIPFLVLLYIIAFIDRANIGYAALEMNEDLGISSTQFGLIAGLFSIGYFIFEVPSNMLMRKVGARRWIARILVTWGIVAVATGFVQNVTQLAIIRTLLGVAEAGFFPAVILYLSFWFPERDRARVVALFMVALPTATVIAGPLSGLILDHVHWLGLESWRWLFVLQGIPAVLLGIISLWVIIDLPKKAKFLSADEKQWLTDTLAHEDSVKVQEPRAPGLLEEPGRRPHPGPGADLLQQVRRDLRAGVLHPGHRGQPGRPHEQLGRRPADRHPLRDRRRLHGVVGPPLRPHPGTPLARRHSAVHRGRRPAVDDLRAGQHRALAAAADHRHRRRLRHLRTVLVAAVAVHDRLRRRRRDRVHQLHRQPRRVRRPVRLRLPQGRHRQHLPRPVHRGRRPDHLRRAGHPAAVRPPRRSPGPQDRPGRRARAPLRTATTPPRTQSISKRPTHPQDHS